MKLITANKLNRFWNNGVLPKLQGKIATAKVLTTVEQVNANTDASNVTGAMVTKELYHNLNGFSFGMTTDGKPGYRKPGADTVIPFSKGCPYIKKLVYNVQYTGNCGLHVTPVITIDPGLATSIAVAFHGEIKNVSNCTRSDNILYPTGGDITVNLDFNYNNGYNLISFNFYIIQYT